MDIKRPTTKEIEQIAILFDEYRQFYKKESDVSAAKDFIKQRFVFQDSLLLGAYKHNKLVAFVQVYPTLSSISMGSVWLINDLYVFKKYRSNGLAKALLEEVINEAKLINVNLIRISTENINITAANLYQRIGFEFDDRFQHFNYFISKG